MKHFLKHAFVINLLEHHEHHAVNMVVVMSPHHLQLVT